LDLSLPLIVDQVMIQGGLGLRQGDGARLFAVAALDGKDVGTTAVGQQSYSFYGPTFIVLVNPHSRLAFGGMEIPREAAARLDVLR